MCLGIPGQVEKITDSSRLTRRGTVSFGGVRKEVNLSLLEEVHSGEYVIVHAGFAINTIDEAEARRIFEYLKEIDELEEVLSE